MTEMLLEILRDVQDQMTRAVGMRGRLMDDDGDGYGRDEKKIGSVERVMIDKQSGKVAYAVLSYGGFLGIGDDHFPTPWSSLKYDTRLGGYVVGITADALQGAPKYGNENDWAWSRENDQRVYDYYKAAPYW